jgi:hypothetical protein
MTGYEETLLTRAEVLEDLAEPASAVSEVLAGAQGAGVDPRAVISLTAAWRLWIPAPPSATARAAGRTGKAVPGTAPTASSSRRCPTPRTRSGSACAR